MATKVDAPATAGKGEASNWGSPPVIIAFVVLLAFGLLVSFMVKHVDASDTAWTRLAYIYGSVEAIVFAAAGAVFGTTIQRAQTRNAEQRAEKEKTRADGNERDAENGKVLAKVVKAQRGKAIATTGAELGNLLSPVQGVDILINTADTLFPNV